MQQWGWVFYIVLDGRKTLSLYLYLEYDGSCGCVVDDLSQGEELVFLVPVLLKVFIMSGWMLKFVSIS